MSKLWMSIAAAGTALVIVGYLVGVKTADTATDATFASAGAASAPEMTVYKNPSCGCCAQWIEHVTQAGFRVKVIETPNPNDLADVMQQNGITPALASCHTALVDGYVIEGHVPADVIRRMLAERPDIRGLAVPGMPVGSPGMEGPNPQHYDVIAFDRAGNTSVYAHR